MNNMRKSRIVVVLTFVFTSLSGTAQYKVVNQRVERIGNTLYLVDNNEKFKVDTKIITVKLRPTEKELGPDYKIVRSNRLGFIDLSVPDGIDAVKEKVQIMLKDCKDFAFHRYICKQFKT